FVFAVGAADRRSGRFLIAGVDQAAQGGGDGIAGVYAGDQRSGFGRGRILRDRLLFAVFADTHAQSICCVPNRVWYHRTGFGNPKGGCAIAPTRPPRGSQPSPKAEENPVRFLTPTGNKRLNELIGFLFMILAVLVALSLISY